MLNRKLREYNFFQRKREIEVIRFRGRDKSIPTKKVPVIINFNLACQTSHEDLVRGITDDFDSILIRNSKDIQEIHAKVFMVFVDFNERNIILEGDREPQQIKKETVDYIMKMGGTAVVIYHLHPDSQILEDGRLNSSKLTSIEFHPTLKELSSRDCVLSIDEQFSEYQRAHIRRICNR
ncbi:uncharacterized protein LOC134267636 [Saccostrea cucullata]|uniref:uncharacterized protein LOC134267636 n=1 Tax=Saccostrea cuccullata TaxID=36930 RepID=UPI002ED5DE7E